MLASPRANTGPASQSPIPGALQTVPSLGNVQTPLVAVPVVALVLLGLYLAWALLHQHEKINAQIEPKNIAANLHNLALIALSAIVALVLAKLATVKFAAMTGWDWAKALATVVNAA